MTRKLLVPEDCIVRAVAISEHQDTNTATTNLYDNRIAIAAADELPYGTLRTTGEQWIFIQYIPNIPVPPPSCINHTTHMQSDLFSRRMRRLRGGMPIGASWYAVC